MSSRPYRKDSPSLSYKQIHLRKSQNSTQQNSQPFTPKNAEYFPVRIITKPTSNRNNQSNRIQNNSVKQPSQSSRQYNRGSIHDSQVSAANTGRKVDMGLMTRQIQKLRKDNARLQKQLVQKDDQTFLMKKNQSELVETYRVIHFYEGKLKELEKICKQYQNGLDSKKQKNLKINQIVQQLRIDNSELSGMNSQKNYELERVSSQLSSLQTRYYKMQQKYNLAKTQSPKEQAISQTKQLDNYARANLLIQPNNNVKEPFIKRRPGLSNAKARGLSSGQSSQSSIASSEYKNNVYINKKKLGSSGSKQSLRSGSKESLQTSRIKVTMLGNLNSRLNNMEKEIDNLKKQNQKLNIQLDQKNAQLIDLHKKNQQLAQQQKIQQAKIKSDHQSIQYVTINKDKLTQISAPGQLKPVILQNSTVKITPKLQNSPTLNKLSQYVSNISQNTQQLPHKYQNTPIKVMQKPKSQNKKFNYSFRFVSASLIRKLTFHLTRQDITYFKMVDEMINALKTEKAQVVRQLLCEHPFNLSQDQCQLFIKQHRSITQFLLSRSMESANKDMSQQQHNQLLESQMKDIIKENIPYFKNITIRKDFGLNIQLSNKFKNYQQDFEDLVKKQGQKIDFEKSQILIKQKWNLTSQQWLFLLLKNYEEYEGIDHIEFKKIGQYFLIQ